MTTFKIDTAKPRLTLEVPRLQRMAGVFALFRSRRYAVQMQYVEKPSKWPGESVERKPSHLESIAGPVSKLTPIRIVRRLCKNNKWLIDVCRREIQAAGYTVRIVDH
jgi:hypothetical protein